MLSIDLPRLEQRARARYERGRVRRALLGVCPLLALLLLALWSTARPAWTACFGLGAIALGASMLWYGREPQRAVLPGVAAGLIPLALSLCANQIQQCGPGGCTSFCAPACTLGGAVAGLVIAGVGRRRRLGTWFWLGASGIALLTGAMGCSCVGHSGLLGLAVGFALGVAPALLNKQPRIS